jgi:3-oxoacyl-[acyl-carrier protein] reductase
LITGVGRTQGIAAAVARRLGASFDLALTGLPPHDSDQADAEGGDIHELVSHLAGVGARVHYVPFDLAEDTAPEVVVARAFEELGRLDVVIAAHAHSSRTPLGSLSVAEIDRHLAVNVRATLMLVEAFAGAFDANNGHGRVVLFSSGQRLGPMPDELAYVASKGGVDALVLSLADVLSEHGITVNAVNPGPTDTGWASGDAYEAIRLRFPAGRWGQPDDAARLVAWLASRDSAWVTGQILNSEGGFRR